MTAVASKHSFLEPSPPDAADEIGRLGHYRVIRQLGMGGMGYVFEAEDVKLKRLVALKVMNQKIAATAGARSRFITEARAMAAIRHDNVATIFEVGQRGETPFMAMEMLSGHTIEHLNAEVKSGKKAALKYDEVIRMAQQMCHGLDAAHARGIVHRDIKPANLWYESQLDRIKVLDFGLALAQTPVDSLAGRGSVIGTPGYLSPEQARGEPLDDRSDLYSLGVVLFELCTGELPIKSRSIHEQLIAILIQKPPLASELNANIPEPLAATVAKLLRKEPRSRYRSASELAEHFDDVLHQCERTSEVAQTIDKLKNTLQSVSTGDSATSPLDAMPTSNPIQQTDLNSLGDVFSQIPSSNGSNTSDPLGGSSGSMPAVRSMQSASSIGVSNSARNGYRPATNSGRSNGSSVDSRMKLYLPLAIIVGMLLLALPIMTFMFGGYGHGSDNRLIQPQSPMVDSGVSPSVTAPQSSKTPKPSPNQSGANDGSKKSSGGKPNANASNGSSPMSSNVRNDGGMPSRGKTAQSKPSVGGSSGAGSNDASSQPKMGGAISSSETIAMKPAMDPSPTVDLRKPAGDSKEMETKGTDQPSPTTPLRNVTVATSDERGADAMVVRGTRQNRGDEPAIAVQTRGDIPTRHSYLRYDLGSIKDDLGKIKFARLALHAAKSKRPVGAKLTLFAIDMKPLWPENRIVWRNSFSEQDLARMTEVASTKVEPGDDSDPIVTIGSSQLADFIKGLENETLTLVLTGKLEDQQVRFFSKEKSAENAPRLQLALEP